MHMTMTTAREGRTFVRAAMRAKRDGLATAVPLDALLRITALWIDSATLRAKLLEVYVDAEKYGLAFVPPPCVAADRYTVIGFETMPTVLVGVPLATIQQVRALPPTKRALGLLQIEACRIAAVYDGLKQPLPAPVAAFFEEHAP